MSAINAGGRSAGRLGRRPRVLLGFFSGAGGGSGFGALDGGILQGIGISNGVRFSPQAAAAQGGRKGYSRNVDAGLATAYCVVA